MSAPNYFEAVDYRQLAADYPLGEGFVRRYATMSRDELRAIQEERFIRCVRRAWQIPFYRRLWSERGIEEGDIRGLDDLPRLPSYSKADLMRSVAEHPPFGDFHGMGTFVASSGAAGGGRPPVVFHTTSGTTGMPQPLFFGPKTREVQNILFTRAVQIHGLRDDDVVHSVYGFGAVNAGHYAREAITHFTGALMITAGTGAETRSVQQIALMHNFGATVLMGFADYIRKLADVAREQGLEPGHDILIRQIATGLGGESREFISRTWGGAEVFDLYGVGDTGIITAEGRDQDGMYIWEDAHVVEIIDPDTLEPVPDGEEGNICVTCLFKDDIFPNIRFNTNDRSAIVPEPADSGWTLRRIRGFLGRSDGMVKLRGTNVYPTAVGELIKVDPDSNGEFLCVVERRGQRDEMSVLIESPAGPERRGEVAERFKAMLRQRVGVELQVRLVEPGALADRTEVERRQKPIRLEDKRPKSG